jgi:hypothetical protein
MEKNINIVPFSEAREYARSSGIKNAHTGKNMLRRNGILKVFPQILTMHTEIWDGQIGVIFLGQEE